MSDNELKLIPVESEFVPAPEVIANIEKLLVSYCRWAEEISVVTTDDMTFIDQGDNFETIICPKCSEELDYGWWQQAMDTAFQNNFKNLNVVVPCCGESTSLNELDYHWPAGFAKFVITFRNPAGDLAENKVRVFEEILGCGLKKVFRHI